MISQAISTKNGLRDALMSGKMADESNKTEWYVYSHREPTHRLTRYVRKKRYNNSTANHSVVS